MTLRSSVGAGESARPPGDPDRTNYPLPLAEPSVRTSPPGSSVTVERATHLCKQRGSLYSGVAWARAVEGPSSACPRWTRSSRSRGGAACSASSLPLIAFGDRAIAFDLPVPLGDLVRRHRRVENRHTVAEGVVGGLVSRVASRAAAAAATRAATGMPAPIASASRERRRLPSTITVGNDEMDWVSPRVPSCRPPGSCRTTGRSLQIPR